jgi:hypothetical protein
MGQPEFASFEEIKDINILDRNLVEIWKLELQGKTYTIAYEEGMGVVTISVDGIEVDIKSFDKTLLDKFELAVEVYSAIN